MEDGNIHILMKSIIFAEPFSTFVLVLYISSTPWDHGLGCKALLNKPMCHPIQYIALISLFVFPCDYPQYALVHNTNQLRLPILHCLQEVFLILGVFNYHLLM